MTAPYTLILLRHGQSEWNKTNQFTGWVDVRLTEQGRGEAARGGELLFHHRLGGDAGVVHTRQPQHLETLHALAAGQRIHQRVVQRMTHVQAAGHVGRGQHDRVRRFGAARIGSEVTGIHPALVQLALYRSRIPRLG